MKHRHVIFLISAIILLGGCRLYSRVFNLPYHAKTLVRPSFPGGYDSLNKFVARYHDSTMFIPDSLYAFDDSFFRQDILLDIDTLGNVSVTPITWAGYEYCKPDIDNIINKMPKWSPAYLCFKGKKEFIEFPASFSVKCYIYRKRPGSSGGGVIIAH